jgi:hypothetical protein
MADDAPVRPKDSETDEATAAGEEDKSQLTQGELLAELHSDSCSLKSLGSGSNSPFFSDTPLLDEALVKAAEQVLTEGTKASTETSDTPTDRVDTPRPTVFIPCPGSLIHGSPDMSNPNTIREAPKTEAFARQLVEGGQIPPIWSLAPGATRAQTVLTSNITTGLHRPWDDNAAGVGHPILPPVSRSEHREVVYDADVEDDEVGFGKISGVGQSTFNRADTEPRKRLAVRTPPPTNFSFASKPPDIKPKIARTKKDVTIEHQPNIFQTPAKAVFNQWRTSDNLPYMYRPDNSEIDGFQPKSIFPTGEISQKEFIQDICHNVTNNVMQEWAHTAKLQQEVYERQHARDRASLLGELHRYFAAGKASTPTKGGPHPSHINMTGTSRLSPLKQEHIWDQKLPPDMPTHVNPSDSMQPQVNDSSPPYNKSPASPESGVSSDYDSDKRIMRLEQNMNKLLSYAENMHNNSVRDPTSKQDEGRPVCSYCGVAGHDWQNCDRRVREPDEGCRREMLDGQGRRPLLSDRPPSRRDEDDGYGSTNGYLPPVGMLVDHSQSWRAPKDRIKAKSFDPEKTEWRDYYAQFVNIASYNGWTGEEQKQHLISVLEGEARGVFSDNKDADLEQLVQLLDERFSPKDREKSYHFQFRARKMGKDEKPEDYSGALSRLARRAYPSVDKESLDKMIVHQFIEGLTDPELHKYVAQYQSYVSNRITLAKEPKVEDKGKVVTVDTPKTGAAMYHADDNRQNKNMSQNQNSYGNKRGNQNNYRGRNSGNPNNNTRFNGGRPNNDNYSNRQQWSNANRGRNNQTGRNGNSNAGGDRQSTMECHFCHLTGHSWRLCRRRLENNPNWIYKPNTAPWSSAGGSNRQSDNQRGQNQSQGSRPNYSNNYRRPPTGSVNQIAPDEREPQDREATDNDDNQENQ